MLNFVGNKQKVIWNTVSQVFGKIISGGIALAINLMVARSFGISGFGEFTLITSYVAFYYLFADFGFNAVFLQKTSDSKNADLKKYWSQLLNLRLILGFGLMLLALAVLAIIPMGINQGYTAFVRLGIIIFLPSIVFQSILTSANAVFQKELRYDLATISLTIGSISSLILAHVVFGISKSHLGLLTIISILLIGGFLTSLSSIFFVKKILGFVKPNLDIKNLTEMFIPSVPLGLILIFNLVYFRIDSIIIGLTRSTAEVGIYSLAYKVFEFALVIPTFFMNALYPVFLKVKPELFRSVVKKSALVLFISSLLLLIILWFASPILVFIKSEFITSVPVLRVLITGLPFFFLSSLCMWGLIAQKKQKVLVIIYGVSMTFVLCADILLIPKFGYIAAAWITVVGEGLVLLLSGLSFISTLGNKKYEL